LPALLVLSGLFLVIGVPMPYAETAQLLVAAGPLFREVGRRPDE
jgi:hypothetical protein